MKGMDGMQKAPIKGLFLWCSCSLFARCFESFPPVKFIVQELGLRMLFKNPCFVFRSGQQVPNGVSRGNTMLIFPGVRQDKTRSTAFDIEFLAIS